MFLIAVKRKPALNRIAPISAAVFRSPDLARKLLLMKIYRSALLRFADDGQAVYDSDALLAVAADASGRQRVVAAGSWQALADQYIQREGVEVIHLPGKLLAPGFVDMHIHYPQTGMIASYGEQLLDWLRQQPLCFAPRLQHALRH